MDKPWACPPAALTVHPSAGSAKSLISVNRACCSSVCQRAVVFDFSVSSWMQRRETKVLMSRPSGAARLSGAVWLALQLPLLLLSESTGNPSLICRVSEVSARLLSRQPQTGTPFLSKDKMIKKTLLAQRFCCLFALSCKLSDENESKYESFKTFSIYLYWSKVFISQPTYCSVSVVECQITEANSSEKCVLTCILACAKTNNIFLQKKAQNKSLHSLASLF